MQIKFKRLLLEKPFLFVVAAFLALFFINVSFAGVSDGVQLKVIAKNVDQSVHALIVVISDICLIAGVGFVMASFFKFHQHKLNPTQIPISQGVTLLLIGTGLVLFPTMLPTAKNALFGQSAKISQIGGDQLSEIIGDGGDDK